MGKKAEVADRDRYLTIRSGVYVYKRRVPSRVQELDQRYPTIRQTLQTRDLAEARMRRDAHEKADDELWASLITGGDRAVAEARYAAAVARAAALGFTYRHTPAWVMDQTFSGIEIQARLQALHKSEPGSKEATAVLGGVDRPKVKVTEAFDVYCDEIVAAELIGKSENQKKDWKKVKLRAITNFKNVVGDKILEEINRDDAIKFFNYWGARVAPKEGKPTHSASSGNRDVGNLRVLYEEYMKFRGVQSFQNPFEGLVFSEKMKKTRPPFPTAWIKDRIMAVGALATMNSQARGVVLALIETGARPSEICNLGPNNIRLDDPIPHIIIEPRQDPDDPREIKTLSSIREVPLVGIALEVFKKHPKGFSRYKNKETGMSNALNKYFKTRDPSLFPTTRHKIYSLRHSFEDRMKVAGLDTELRMMLMGHTIDRPSYGEGGTLQWKRDEMLKIALPFDPSIV